MVSILPFLFTGCVDEAPATSESESPIVLEGPTVLSFYESANATGQSMTVSLAAADTNEALRLISKPDITNAGLAGKVSAVRLSCKQRAARVVLLDAPNTSNTSFASWVHLGGQGATINCNPYQSVTVDLHTSFPALADRVGSAVLVTHATGAGFFNFSDDLEQAWGVALDDLPSGATPGDTQFWVSALNHFHVRQNLTLDSWACTARGAVFEYDVTMHEDATFAVSIADLYVDYGFGDAWGCHDQMVAELDASIHDGAGDFAQGLRDLVTLYAPGHTHYYLVPDVHLSNFDMFFRSDPIVVRP